MKKTRPPCELCGRTTPSLTKHHLIPKARHNKRVKAKFGDECKKRIAMFCTACHRQIHYLFTHKELESEYNTIEALMGHPDVAKYAEWIRKKPDNFVPSKGKRK